MLEGLFPWSTLTKDTAHALIVELSGRFEVPVPEVKFTCRYSNRGWYHYPECQCGCQRHPHGSIRLGRLSRTLSVAIHEFAHHLLRHKLYDWRDVASHGPDFKRYLDKAIAEAEELGMRYDV